MQKGQEVFSWFSWRRTEGNDRDSDRDIDRDSDRHAPSSPSSSSSSSSMVVSSHEASEENGNKNGNREPSQLQLQLRHLRQAQQSRLVTALSIANFRENQRLSTRQSMLERQVVSGHAAMAALQRSASYQIRRIDHLEDRVCSQNEEIQNLDTQLCTQRSKLDDIIAKYGSALYRQQLQLDAQQEELSRLTTAKVKHDLLIDIAIMIFGGVVTNSRFTHFITSPLSMLIGSTVGSSSSSGSSNGSNRNPSLSPDNYVAILRKADMSLKLMIRLFIFTRLVKTLRVRATQFGFHNDVGNVDTYTNLISDQAKKLIGPSATSTRVH